MRRMHKQNREEGLIKGWSAQYGRPLTSADVEEINTNLSAFVDVMHRIDCYLRRKRKRKHLSGGEIDL